MEEALLTKIHMLELENRHLKGQIAAFKFFVLIVIGSLMGACTLIFKLV